VKQAEAEFPPIGKFVTVEGTRLHYLCRGEGKPIVLLHGNPGLIQDFSLFVLDQLAQEYRVCIVERPGHGYSDRPQNEMVTSIVQARLLHGALQQLGIEQPVLVGYSWGSSVALAYALNYPDDLAGLVLLAPLAFRRERANPLPEIIAEIPVIGDLLRAIFPVVLGRELVQQNLVRAFTPDPVPSEYLRIAQALWTRPSQTQAITQDNITINPTLTTLSPRYSDIKRPTVIVVGNADRIVNAQENAIALNQAIATSTLINLPNTNHAILQTRPEAVFNAIRLVYEQISSWEER
jgi:pimeloyl-ACP methyl ester carboxylesterase